jgi:hypothetical protein
MLVGVVYAAPVSSQRAVARAPGASVPTYNIEATCRAMASVPEARLFDSNAPNAPDVTQRCIQEESQARDELLKRWSQFKPADRALCDGVSRAGDVDPAYTELETCLEMAQENHGSDTSTSPVRHQSSLR